MYTDYPTHLHCGTEELSQHYSIGGVIVYELLDQPHLYPSSEALYGLVRVVENAPGELSVGGAKPVFHAIAAWNGGY